MSLERDPADGKVAFFPAEVSFEVETAEDVVLILAGLRKSAELFKKNYGHTGYPILRIEESDEGQS